MPVSFLNRRFMNCVEELVAEAKVMARMHHHNIVHLHGMVNGEYVGECCLLWLLLIPLLLLLLLLLCCSTALLPPVFRSMR